MRGARGDAGVGRRVRPPGRPVGRRGVGWRTVAAAAVLLLVLVPTTFGGGRPAAAATATVAYGSSPYQTMTVYAAASSKAPLVVLVHGGGWTSRPGSDYLPTEAGDLHSAGFAVFDVNYDTVSPGSGAFPLEIDDVVSATEWAIGHATDYDASAGDVEMVGGSAGGQLVAMAAEEIDSSAPGSVKSVVTLSGALDFVKKIRDIKSGIVKGYDAYHAQEALGCSLKVGNCTVSVEREWSPAENASRSNCPDASLVINSAQESEPVDQANSMTAALRQQDCAVTEHILDGRQHSFAYWNSVESEVAAFLVAN